MACLLKKGNGIVDAIGKANDEPTVLIESEASPGVVVIAGTYDGKSCTVSGANKVKLPPLKAGDKDLRLVIDGVLTGDDIELFEDCEAKKELSRGAVGSAPGGAGVLIGFTIRA